MATTTLTRGTTLPDSAAKADFHNLVDTATGSTTGIVNADIASGAAIVDSKLAQITTASKVSGAAITGTIVTTKGADIASATTTDIGAATGNLLDVTGTTTITGLGTVAAGALRIVRFTGALILTHHGTSLILPTGANITTAAGDTATFESLGSGNWVCLSYQRKNGTSLAASTAANALAGSVVQVVNVQTGAYTSGSTAMPFDDTIPQITEGDEYMTLAIIPSSATNKLKITVTIIGVVTSATTPWVAALFQDATAGALAAGCTNGASGNDPCTLTFSHYMTSGTTSATTFRVRAGGASGTFNFNGQGSARRLGGVLASSITIDEIKV